MPFDSTNYQPSDPVLRLLIEGKRFIEQPEHWVQGPYAVTISRCVVEPNDPMAISFCSSGALKAATYKEHGRLNMHWVNAANLLADAALSLGGERSLSPHVTFNDQTGRTHSEVMGMWSNAIAARVAEQAKVTA